MTYNELCEAILTAQEELRGAYPFDQEGDNG